MDPTRWRRVEEIYQAASDRAPAERGAFLAAACAGDEDLRREVESLLAQPSADGLLDRPAWESDEIRERAGAVRNMQPDAAWPAAGQRVGRYEIQEKVGEGGMGLVYKARDSHLKRFVALKVLPPEKVTDPERKQRFVQEARAASALNHPNIVTVYDIDRSDGIDFIAMEYVEGKTLDELIGRKGLRLNEALKLAIQIADALAKAHAAGIVHRDLKPGNVMVTPDGRVKVLDFGLAKLTETALVSPEDERLTERQSTELGMVLGTASYMSPEQVEGKKVDSRSDIFSFGSVLYEMLTGWRAFRRGSTASTLAAVLHMEPALLPEGTPGELERVVARCLRKDPARRFQTMADLKVALEELREESESGKLTGRPAGGPKRRWRRLWAAGVAATLLLAAAAVWRLWEAAPPGGLNAVPLTSYSGVASPPSLSPDGSKVAFGWNGEKEGPIFHIYVMRIGGSGAPVLRTSDPAWEGFPAWSPDDRWIAFERQQKDNFAVLLVPPEGGSERKVTEIAAQSHLSWTPDAKWLAFLAPDPAPGGPHSIWAVNIDTAERRRLTAFVPQSVGVFGDRFPSISPDGSALAFARQVRNYVYDLYVQRLTRDLHPNGEPRRVTQSSYAGVLGITWTADSREIVYGAGFGPFKLWRVPASGGRAPELLSYASASESAFCPSISGPARRLVYNAGLSHSDLWRLDIRSKERKVLIGSTSVQYNAQYSPDGRKIAFSSSRGGNNDAWTCDAADGANCRPITNCQSQCGTPRWSPDSQWLALDSRKEDDGRSQIYVVAADGGTLRRVTNDPSGAMIPSWSHDGSWIYFVSDRSGQYEIWKTRTDGGEAVQVTRSGGYGAFESPDGKYLYHVKHLQAGLFRMPAQGGEETQILPVPPGWPLNHRAFGVTSKGVYFFSDAKTIQFLDSATGKIGAVAAVDQSAGELTVSQDDAYVVYPLPGQSSTNLMLVEGFR